MYRQYTAVSKSSCVVLSLSSYFNPNKWALPQKALFKELFVRSSHLCSMGNAISKLNEDADGQVNTKK